MSAELRQVDPVPLPDNDLSIDSAESIAKSSSSSSSSSSSHDKPHGTLPRSFFAYVQKVQRYSSYSFSAFITMHAASVVVAPLWSIEAAESTLQFTSALYQSPLIEPWLVYGSLGLHIASGILLRAHKVYLTKKHYDKWSFPKPTPVSISGFVLTPFLLGHMYSTRIAPQFVLGDSSLISLNFIAHFFHKHRVLSGATYFMLSFLTAYHVIWGYKKWFGLYGRKYRRPTFTIYFGVLLASVISMVRIARLPKVSGWLASQFDLVLKSLWLN